MRELAIEIGVRALLFGVFVFTEFLDPFQRVIQPEEIWLYKNPLVQSDNIPTRLMFAISFLTPLAVICVVKIIRRTDKTEIKEAFLAVSLALALNGVCTNTIKLIVGRWSDELGNALHRGPRPGVRGPQKLPQHPLLLDTAWRGVWSIRREIGSHRDGKETGRGGRVKGRKKPALGSRGSCSQLPRGQGLSFQLKHVIMRKREHRKMRSMVLRVECIAWLSGLHVGETVDENWKGFVQRILVAVTWGKGHPGMEWRQCPRVSHAPPLRCPERGEPMCPGTLLAPSSYPHSAEGALAGKWKS
uniref:Phospholipid phosphatase 4 n=1 Tax=Sus scrofa TaxID=9823 RepID=A0A8D1MSG1_PIG